MPAKQNFEVGSIERDVTALGRLEQRVMLEGMLDPRGEGREETVF